jgi:pyruvate/2-oxoglutarate/acetoin dehydrogenase E1 component
LRHVAADITEKGGDVTVIAVGDAVNTIYLKSREATHDIDFSVTT